MQRRKSLRYSLAILGIAMIVGCATQEPVEFRPRPDMAEIEKMLNCPPDRTPVCIERIGKPYSCFCMAEDALRQILEPTRY